VATGGLSSEPPRKGGQLLLINYTPNTISLCLASLSCQAIPLSNFSPPRHAVICLGTHQTGSVGVWK